MGPLELFILLIVIIPGFILPAVILHWIAKRRGRSGHMAWWALLGWFGFAIGLLIMLMTSAPQRTAAATPQPPHMDAIAEKLHTLTDLHERGLLTDEEYAERRAREIEQI